MPRSGPGPAISRPWTRIWPASAGMKPPRMWSSVLLPQPLGPTTVTNSPSAPRDVAGERRLHALLAPVGLRELVGEHDRVFHRHARALSEIRRQRVRGVAEQRDAAACPGLLAHLLDVGAHDALGRRELGERASHARVREAAEQRLQRADALER